ncbi:hypothetical protein INR49_032037 [Caranx melampygus]|nr:hypothetical protein INR49_032037 [Caranx melampygus]
MEREKRNDTSFSRKRSFTFGAYGGESKPFLSASCNQRDTELFEIIEKLQVSSSTIDLVLVCPVMPEPQKFLIINVPFVHQGSRIDEQRCVFPLPLKSPLSTIGGELPLILPSKLGGYWIDPSLERLVDVSPTPSQYGLDPESYDLMERDREATIYQEFFRSRYHHSFTAVDPSLGPLVLSVCLEEEENKLRVILRMKECSLHGVFSVSLFPNMPSAVELAKAPELITAFDEHRVSPNFKFGVLYQKEGQLTEEDILSNNDESDEFKEFLSILGETIQLQGFTGFRGGLDVCHGQTGSEALYTSFHGREIMFHVATKLPFTEGDPQQLQRKRHIGNDIVALVYQEGQTPFLSDVIKSHFLHCFLVVRRIQRGEETDAGGAMYQVCITAREDVPPFGPVIPHPPIFTDRSVMREFLLTKLINAEISCYKSERFSKLELRTRSSLLESLQAELSTRSQCMMGDPSLSALPSSEGVRGTSEGSGGFIENFKRAIRVRSHSFETLGVPRKTGSSASQKPKTDKDGERMTSKKVIELFYDVVSPYSWLGFEVMCRYRHVWNIELKLRPAFLGGIMQGSGNKPPGLVPNKFLYMNKDLNRLAQYFDVPLQAPSDPFEAMFKKGSLSAMRFVAAVQEREKGRDKQVEQVSRELWRRIWSEDKDITQPASLSEAAKQAGLSDGEIKELLQLSTSKEIKEKLKSTTQEALDIGAFGFPWWCVMSMESQKCFLDLIDSSSWPTALERSGWDLNLANQLPSSEI